MVDQSSRTELQAMLTKFTKNVWYQPSSNTKLEYPCIVYKRSDIDTTFANNYLYKTAVEYQLTVITKDPDDTLPFELLKTLPMASYSNDYVTNNLYHTILLVYMT